MKYIIFESNSGLKYPILFPDFIDHSTIVHERIDKPISAGRCELQKEQIACYGHSVTLGLHSHPEDSEIVNREFNEYYDIRNIGIIK